MSNVIEDEIIYSGFVKIRKYMYEWFWNYIIVIENQKIYIIKVTYVQCMEWKMFTVSLCI